MLPVEILYNVFRLVISTPLHAHVVSNVSRRWREVSLSLPTLWNNLQIFIAHCYPPPPLLRLWINRTTGVLLQITIRRFDDPRKRRKVAWDEEERWEYLSGILKILGPETYRWKTLSINLDACDMRVFDGFRLDTAVDLQELDIDINDSITAGENAIIASLATIPASKSLRWFSNSIVELSPMLREFRWDQLAWIALAWGCSWEDIAHAISLCTSAVYISVEATHPVLDIHNFPRHILLPHLRTLLITTCITDGLVTFSHLDAPSLCILRVEVGESDLLDPPSVHDPYQYLTAFISSGKHSIQMARLNLGSNWDLSSVRQILLACQSASIPSVEMVLFEHDGEDDFGIDFDATRLEPFGSEFKSLLPDLSGSFPPFRVLKSAKGSAITMGWLDINTVTRFVDGIDIPYFSFGDVKPNLALALPRHMLPSDVLILHE